MNSIISDCQSLADELMARFEKLKASGKLRERCEVHLEKKELDELQMRLQQRRERIGTAHARLLEEIHLSDKFSLLCSPHRRENVNLLGSRKEDQFHALQTSVIAKLTEAIGDQVSAFSQWPKLGEETQYADERLKGAVDFEQPIS
jgi:hypothetical protein